MPTCLSLRRLSATALLSLSLLAALLALPAASLARAHKASCSTSSSRAHAKRATRKCATPARKPAHHKAKRRRKHSAGAKLPAGVAEAGSEGGEALCEDGSGATASSEGFSCEDGSEPGCEAGLVAAPSSDGSSLLCQAPPAEEPEAALEPES